MPDDLDIQALTLPQKIDFFEHRVRLWMLEPPQHMASAIEESGWAVLQVALQYFEMIGKFRAGYCGIEESPRYFKEGFKWVFMDSPASVPVQAGRLDALLNRAYASLREGLWHCSLRNPHILLNDETIVPLKAHFLSTGKDYLEINPRMIVEPLADNLAAYLSELRDPAPEHDQTRAFFEARFDWLEQAQFAPATRAAPRDQATTGPQKPSSE